MYIYYEPCLFKLKLHLLNTLKDVEFKKDYLFYENDITQLFKLFYIFIFLKNIV